jgi:hypothetical protein
VLLRLAASGQGATEGDQQRPGYNAPGAAQLDTADTIELGEVIPHALIRRSVAIAR